MLKITTLLTFFVLPRLMVC